MCLFEFGLTMEYTEFMTWAEYRIRLYGFERAEKRMWIKVRELAWSATRAPHLDPKTIPKSRDKFMPLSEKADLVTDKMRDRMKQALDEYNKKNNKKDV